MKKQDLENMLQWSGLLLPSLTLTETGKLVFQSGCLLDQDVAKVVLNLQYIATKGLQINPLSHLIELSFTKIILSLPWPGVVVFVCNIEEGGERVLKEKDITQKR